MELLTQNPRLRPDEALDRVLALRPEDLDAAEERLARRVPETELEREAARDAQLSKLLAEWDGAVPGVAPSVESILAHIEMRAQLAPVGVEVPEAPVPGLRPHGWLASSAVAAALVVLGLALGMRAQETAPVAAIEPEGGRWKGGRAQDNRLELLVSVERPGADRTAVVAGRQGEVYAPTDGLVLRAELRGEGGFFYLFERSAGGLRRLWPEDGESLRLAPGLHDLRDDSGDTLVYRPDVGVVGPATYLALVTREAVEGPDVAEAVLGAAPTGAWPATVLLADTFELRWAASE